MKAASEKRQLYLFIVTWAIATVFFGWQYVQGKYILAQRLNGISTLVMLLCTATLLVWIPNPVRDESSQNPTKPGLFVLLILISIGILFLIPTRAVRILFFVLPGIAILVLILLRQPLQKNELLYGSGL